MGNVALAAATKSALKVGIKMDVWDLIWNAGLIVKFVLVLLMAFSVLSWAIILSKNLQLTRLNFANGRFLDAFWKATSLDSIYNDLSKFASSSLAPVFKAGYTELQRIAESNLREKSNE